MEDSEPEIEQPQEVQPKKQYIRKFTDEARQKQKQHLDDIRKKAMEKKREMKEITLKAKLMKLEPKIELAKKYDEYVNNKVNTNNNVAEIIQQQPIKQKQKKVIYKEVSEDDEEEEIIYVKKHNKPPPRVESLDKTLYKSATEQLHMRALEERIKNNLVKWNHALMPQEY